MAPSTSSTSRRSIFGLWSKHSSSSTTNVDIEAQNSSSDCTNMIDDFFGVTYSREERAARRSSTAPIQLPTAPAPAYTSPSCHSWASIHSYEQSSDAILDFFGIQETAEQRQVRLQNDATLSTSSVVTHVSRHDEPSPSSSTIEIGDAIPPPYDLESQTDSSTVVEACGSNSLPSYETVSSSPKAPAYPHPEPYTIPQFLFKYGFFCPLLWFLGTCLLVDFHHPLELIRLYGPEESAVQVSRLRAAELRWAKRCLLAFVIFTFAVLLIVGMVYGIVVSVKV